MKLSRFALFLLPAFVLGMVPACKSDSGKIKIAVVTNNPEDFWKICEAGARKAAKQFDVELIFRTPDNADVGIQRQIVKSLTEQGVGGIAVSVIDPKEQAPDLKQIASKTKLVTMDNDADGSSRICYVGTDNYAAGREVGRLVKRAMSGGGDIAIFVGQITPINARQRFQGVVDELAGAGGKDVQGVDAKRKIGDKEIFFRKFGDYYLYNGEAITDGAKKEQALKNAKDALEILGDRDSVCMVGLWAYNPPKILEAISSKGYTKVKVVGFDEDELTLTAIDQGKMFATVVQDPFNFGFKSVEILAAEARGDHSKSGIKPIPYRIITRDGGQTKTIDDVEIKNLKASDFRDDLRKLLDSVK
jgi:ribose transport system substrate-binding protein